MAYADLSKFDTGRVFEGALDILENIGISIESTEMLGQLTGKMALRDGRARIPRGLVQEYLDAYRAGKGQPEFPECTGDISIRASGLNCSWLDPADGMIKPMDTEAAIRNTVFLQKAVSTGAVRGDIAGVPQDVPGELQYVMAQYIKCVYTPNPGCWGIYPNERVMRACMEMSGILGAEQSMLMEIISPLKMAGQSVDLTLKHHREFTNIWNDPMPILGVTAPADWHMAWSQSVAENLGAYVLYRICGVDNISIGSFRLFVPNPSTTMTYFSSPMHAIALLTRRKLRRELLGEDVRGGESLLIAGKIPDQQAAAEKMAGMAFAKAHGFDDLEGAGGLFMDEIFSPEQLVIDIELKDFMNGIKADFEPREQDILDAVGGGVSAGSYLASDMTLERFYDFAWKPRLFDLRTKASWLESPKSQLERAKAVISAINERPAYELEGEGRAKVEEILARVWKD